MYTVTFDANGGSGGPGAQTKWHGEDLTLSAAKPTRSGYIFDHWCKNPDSFWHAFVKEYQPGDQYTKDEDITLYAHWEKSTETTASAERPDFGSNKPTAEGEQPAATQPPTNGDNKAQQADYLTSCTRYPSYGRVSVKTADYLYSLPCDSSTDSRSVKGTKQSAGVWLSVDGLYKNSKGQYWYSVELPSGAGYISAASTTSYQCTPLLKDVTIENAALPKNHIQGKSYSIGGTIRAGHLYLNEVAGSIQDSYNHSSTKTLSYSNDQQCTSLNLKSSAINTALKFGSLKAGNCLYVITVSADYYYSADGKTLSFWRQTEDLIWHEFKVVAQGKEVRFLSEGKEIYSTTVTETDNYLTMQSKPYDKPGHTFKGWYAYRDSDGTWYTDKGWQTQSSIDKNNYTKKLYSAGSKYNLYHSSWGDSDFTFYAVWEYTGSGKDARFVSDGTPISSFHATPGNSVLTIAAAPAGQPGYNFLGWNVQRDADGTWYVDGRGWNTEASITANKYTKKLYAPGTKVDLYDSAWVDEASVTFYALWKAPDTYAVTYDANGGTGAPEGQRKLAGIDLTLSDTVPSRPGCQFLGWAADSGATAPEYQPGDSYTADAAVTLYAVWQVQTGLQVPDVTGMYVGEAQLLLQLSGFVPDDFEWSPSLTVAAQSPAAGTYSEAGSTVTLSTTGIAPDNVPRLMGRYPIDDGSVRSWEEQGTITFANLQQGSLYWMDIPNSSAKPITHTTEKLCQVELSISSDPILDGCTFCILAEAEYLHTYLHLLSGTEYFGNPDTALVYLNKGSYPVVAMKWNEARETYEEWVRAELTVTGSGRYELTIQPTEKHVPDVTGMRFDEACTLLKEEGFAVDKTAYSADAVVDGQTPAAHTFAVLGSTVSLSCGDAEGRSATSAYRYAVIDPVTGAGLAWLDDDHLQPDTVEKDALSQTLNEVKLHITGSGYQGYPMKLTPGGHLSPEYGWALAPDGNGDISIGTAPQSYTLWIEAAEGKFLCFPFTVSGAGTIDIDLTRKINVSYYNEDGSLYRTDEIDAASVSAEISVGSYDQVKEGYTFAGWSVNGGTPMLHGSSVFTAFDISFTAVWTENTPDEEPVGENDAPKMYGAPEPVADPEPSTEPEPTPDPESSTAPEPTPDPEPSTAPEPTPDPEPSTDPEPSPNLEPAPETSE